MNNQLVNLKESFWNKTFYASALCPECDIQSELWLSVNKSSVKMECKSCNKVFFYRRVNLGVLE